MDFINKSFDLATLKNSDSSLPCFYGVIMILTMWCAMQLVPGGSPDPEWIMLLGYLYFNS
jgi:hypothetical protein